MADIDAELVTALKMAKSKKMFFAFIPKGSDGQLIVSKKKIPQKEIAEIKKDIGGGQPILGKCFGPIGAMVFQVLKQPSPTLEAALKKVAKRDSGLLVIPDVQLASDAEEDEPEETGGPAAPAVAPAPPAAPVQSPPPSASGPGNAAPAAAPDLGPWQAARQNAINDLKALAAKVAGTRHTSAAGVVKEIQAIISKLPANPAPNDIDKLEAFIRTDDTITAAEEVPGHFHDLDIREPLLKALEGLKK
jgi:hypothetical protein